MDGNMNQMNNQPTKFCQHCGAVIPAAAVVCTNCGCQTGQMQAETPNIVIQNTNVNTNTNINRKCRFNSFIICSMESYNI